MKSLILSVVIYLLHDDVAAQQYGALLTDRPALRSKSTGRCNKRPAPFGTCFWCSLHFSRMYKLLLQVCEHQFSPFTNRQVFDVQSSTSNL